MQRVRIIPRWGGSPESDFYPWLARELKARKGKVFKDIQVMDMPNPSTPILQDWLWEAGDAIGDDPYRSEHTLLIGHSVGCRAILHALADVPEGMYVGGVLMVAGWFTVDEPWETLKPWIDVPFDMEAARAACKKMVVLLSDNDPYTSDFEANKRAWIERFGAEVRVIPGAKHFNAAEEPAVLEAVLERFA